MKKILIVVVAALALVGVGSVSAQSRSSYFMEGSYFRNDMNPALAPTRGYVALSGLGGVGVDLSTNFLSIDKFVFQRDNELVTALNSKVTTEEFLGKLPSKGKLSMDMKTKILGAGFYIKDMYWTFGVNANVSASSKISMDLFKAVKSLGNGLYDLGDTALNLNSYIDINVGSAFSVYENIRVGAKIKFLVGLVNMNAQFDELSANVTPESVSATVNGAWRANGMLFDNSQVNSGEEMGFNDLISSDIGYMLSNFKSYGVAFDLGAEATFFDDHLKVSAAVTDLGFIRWGKPSHVGGSVNGDFTFNGVNLGTSQLDADGGIEMEMVDNSTARGYASMINVSVNVGAEYNILQNRIAFGLLSHTKFCNTMAYSEFVASVNFRPLNWLSATISQTFMHRQRLGVLGFALNIHPCAVNFFAGVDFIDTAWVGGPGSSTLPRYMKSVNAYVGMGFNFARPKFMR